MEELNIPGTHVQKALKGFSIKHSGAFILHCDESVSVHDDEIVTYDLSHDELYPNPRPPMITEHRFVFDTRPQTESGLSRFNTGELFAFEEDEFYMKLTFQERLTHPRWQVRKKLYMDIADSLRTGRFFVRTDSELNVFEYFEPFLKDLAWDSNLTSQLEGLSCILVYVKLVPTVKNSLFFLADELIQKCALTKQKSGELVSSIVFELIAKDAEGMLLHLLIKRFTAKYPKEICFVINCVKQGLSVMSRSESVVKDLIAGLNKTLTHSIVEVRNASFALAGEVFVYISDDIDTFIKNLDLKALQVKEFKDLISSKEKLSVKWTFFAKETKKTENSDLLILEENFQSYVVDLTTLIPEGFYDIPYSNEIKVNRDKLLRLTHTLETPGLVIEKKEYPTIVNTLLHLLESNNNLIYTEAIKILELLIPKTSKSFCFKYKPYVQFLSEKFKEKKKSLLASLFSLLRLFRVHEVCSLESIVEVLLENMAHKNPQVRELSLTWISQEVQQLPSTVDLLEMHTNTDMYEKIIENLVFGAGNRVLMVALKDTVGFVRDSATRLLNVFKAILPNCAILDTLLSRLPKGKVAVDGKREEIEGVKEPVSPVPVFPALVPGLSDRDQFALTMVLEDVKRYSEGIFKPELIINNLKKIEKDSLGVVKSLVVDTVVAAFYNFSLGKLESSVIELNTLIEMIIREVGNFEENLIKKFINLVLMFPGCVNKNSQKIIESTLDEFFVLNDQLGIISSCFIFISDLKTKKNKFLNEEKAIICLKFTENWVLKHLKRSFIKSSPDTFSGFIDLILNIKEQEFLFSDTFIKELQNTKRIISTHIRKCLSENISPLKSRSPNLSISDPIETKPEQDSQGEIKEIIFLLNEQDSSQKLEGLNRLMAMIEEILEAHHRKLQKNSWKRGIGREFEESSQPKRNLLRLSLDGLERFVKDIIFLCTRNREGQQVLFEELQENMITALTSLRLTLTDDEAEFVFKWLFYSLPVENSSGAFAKSFNLLVYQLFSDWLSHLSTTSVISLVAKCFSYNDPFNINHLHLHTIQWLLETELKLGNFSLNDLDPLTLQLAKGLLGGPLHSSHPLSHNTKQLLVFHSQIFIEYLIELFTFDNVCEYFEEKLEGRVLEEFEKWAEKFRDEMQSLQGRDGLAEGKVESGKVQDFKCEKVGREESWERKEEGHEEHLEQETLNYELMQKLKLVKEKKVECEKFETKKAPLIKPSKDFDDILQTGPESKPGVSMFQLETPDEPSTPFYLQEDHLPTFQLSLLLPKENLSNYLIDLYRTIPPSHKKPFLHFINKSLSNTDIFSSLSISVLKSLLRSIIHFCVIEKLSSTQPSGFLIKNLAGSSDLELTHELQKLLALLMDYHDTSAVVCILFELIQEALPENFYLPLTRENGVALRLVLKFCVRIVANFKGLRVFACLFSLNQLFVKHPPEGLNSDCENVQEYEYMFKVLRTVSDGLIAIGPDKALAFLKFVSGKERSVYLKYLAAVLGKKYGLS